MLPYITILEREIPLYGIFFYIGVLVASISALLLSHKKQMPPFDIVGSAIYVMTGALLGSKLLFIAVSFREIIEHEISFLGMIKGGFVFYGGLIGGALGLLIYIWQFKLKFFDYADLYATVLPLGHAFGRVGCFFAGCCYGMPYDGFFSHTYTASAGTTPLGVSLLAIQLIEAFFLFLLFFLLLAVFLRQSKKLGLCCTVYATVYAVLRFVLEFFRGDKERGVLFFSTSQWISLAILISILMLIIRKKYKASQKNTITADENTH